ncbi:MAG: Ppx/GppA phosphatase family protein [Syntrophobacterales bacterium]|jgi:exopolyphosphatase/guanosine-5'-triphosphate,3'-diphosphate pyrophosphatase
MQRFASIDLGSNTIRLLIAEPEVSAPLRPIHIQRRITRLGENFLPDRILQPEAMARSIAALKEFVALMGRNGVSECSAGATAVVREASNGSDFLNLVQRETGLVVRVLSGTEEARLSLLGVASVITNEESAMVVFDIGGGSTELVWQGDSSDIESFSLAVGVVHLTERFLQGDPPGHEACLQVREYVSTVLKELSFHQNYHDSLWVGTAGTVTTLASMWYEMTEYDSAQINGAVLEKAWLVDLCAQLAEMKLTERRKLTGLEPGREDIILAGGLVTLEMMEVFGFSRFTVSDAGLLEGLFLDLCRA